ncbi:Bug family tripartite tricarboxylate transporter substrate binding protein [Pararoseomonas indoligenes]|uniref:Tripartite tricarboxylate transporter substrate binding protein n=1 Tax=Roseomonas indoligenes TaxID=2820811 RepID=A0A940N2Q4_9PROT|nr:tripartite tricarboxylate transporter substrate binding protein [Pararoseomonas indoligenes]MBP0494941.1 tripartite tricarboxylate transporter substrate binding protein [Pararoseomonas indoligenes]
MAEGQMEKLTRRTALALPLLAAPALAEPAWPRRPIRIIVPFAPGASNDLIARATANGLQPVLDVPVVVENKPGAGGAIGAASVAAAPADGYTVMIATTSIAMAAAVQPTPYDPARDFDAVRLLAQAPIGLVVAGNSPFQSVTDLLAAARAKPGTIRYGSAGPGTVNHFAGALFALRAGISMEHVPYRGMSPAIMDMLGGRIEVNFPSLPSVSGQLRTGEARLLGVLAPERQGDMPEVPTVREAGVNMDLLFWWGILGPRGMPAAVTARFDKALLDVLGTAEVLRFLANEGASPARTGARAFQAFLAAETTRWAEVARAAGIIVG